MDTSTYFSTNVSMNPKDTQHHAPNEPFKKLFTKKPSLYPILSYSFRGNYSFLNLEIQRSQYMRSKFTVHKFAETIQGQKLYEEIRYVDCTVRTNRGLIWREKLCVGQVLEPHRFLAIFAGFFTWNDNVSAMNEITIDVLKNIRLKSVEPNTVGVFVVFPHFSYSEKRPYFFMKLWLT